MSGVDTAELARSITWNGSKQAYYTARIMVDRDLVDDFLRAYAYFRWMDDVIDVTSSSKEERVDFISRQKELIDTLYQGGAQKELVQEEQILADLIHNDRFPESGLKSFITNMFAIIEFDAQRKGRQIESEELNWYTDRLAQSVTDGMQYFVGNGFPYPRDENRLLAAEAAHITHLLRDMAQDTADGFINIPASFLEENSLTPSDFDKEPYLQWVKQRVELARDYFARGKRYLDSLRVLRCRMVGHWYCARFEGVLDSIERDEYHLRAEYSESRNLSTWLAVAGLGISIPVRHVLDR